MCVCACTYTVIFWFLDGEATATVVCALKTHAAATCMDEHDGHTEKKEYSKAVACEKSA